MLTKLSVGSYDIINSGVVLIDTDKEFQIDTTFQNGFRMKIVFQFIKTENGEQKLVSTIDGSDTLKIIATNFNNSLGTGTVESINIATVDNKKVKLHFWSYLLNDAVRKIEYTLFWEK